VCRTSRERGVARNAASATRGRATTTSRNTSPPISTAPSCSGIKRAAVPHDRPRHRQAHPHGAAAGERLCDDPLARGGAGIATRLGNHSFRATGITAYLKNGTLEKAAAMANHGSTGTTQLYDRRRDEVSLDEVKRIGS